MNMDRGLRALIASRTQRDQPVTGLVGNYYSDITQSIFLQNRDRLRSLGPTFATEWDEHELLYARWFAFYGSAINDNPDVSSPDLEKWYRGQAVWWSTRIDKWAHSIQPHTAESGGVGVVVVAIGAFVVAAVAIGVSK